MASRASSGSDGKLVGEESLRSTDAADTIDEMKKSTLR